MFFFLRIRRPPRSTLFPYTPLFRSIPPLEPYLRTARPQARLVLQHLGLCEARLERRAAPQDSGGYLCVRLRVPHPFLCGPTEDAILRARDYVGNALGVLFVEEKAFEAGVTDAHDLTPYRLHGGISDQLARAEPGTVDDHAPVWGLFERRDDALLDVPAGPDKAVQEVAEVDWHLDDRRDEGVAVAVAGRQLVRRCAPDAARHRAGPPGFRGRIPPQLDALAHAHAAFGDAGGGL